MSITAISYDWGVSPTMVRITTTDTLAAITTAAYWTGQATVIDTLNNGAFTFPDGSLVAISYSGGQNTFTYNSTTAAFVPVLDLSSNMQHIQVDVTLAEFIGQYTASVALVAAPATGQKIILHRASLAVNYGGTVLALGGAVHIQYASTNQGLYLAAATADFTGGTASTYKVDVWYSAVDV